MPETDIESPPAATDCPLTMMAPGSVAACIACPWIVVVNGAAAATAAGPLFTGGAEGELRFGSPGDFPPATTFEAAGSTGTCWPGTCTADAPPPVAGPATATDFGSTTVLTKPCPPGAGTPTEGTGGSVRSAAGPWLACGSAV